MDRVEEGELERGCSHPNPIPFYITSILSLCSYVFERIFLKKLPIVSDLIIFRASLMPLDEIVTFAVYCCNR